MYRNKMRSMGHTFEPGHGLEGWVVAFFLSLLVHLLKLNCVA